VTKPQGQFFLLAGITAPMGTNIEHRTSNIEHRTSNIDR